MDLPMADYLRYLTFSALLTGLQGMAALGFLSFSLRRGLAYYRVLLFISLAGFLYGLLETAILNISYYEYYSAAMELSRLQQIVLTFFLILMPLALKAVEPENRVLKNLNRFFLYFGTASALIITLFAFLLPDLFKSLVFTSGVQFMPLADPGRGREGPLFHTRNHLLALYMGYLIFQLLWTRYRWGQPPEARGLLLGTVPAVSLGLLEILQDSLGVKFPGLGDILPVPLLWGLTFFSGANLLLSRQVESGARALNLPDQLSGIDLSGQRKPGTKALLLVDMGKSRLPVRWRSETRKELTLGRIRSCLRNSDRLGWSEKGEAVVVLEQLGHPADAAMAAAKILDVTGPSPRPSTIGIALIPRDGSDITALYQKASQALEKARTEGKSYSFLSEAHNSEAQHRLVLLESLKKSPEFPEQYEIHFQPIFRRTGELAGCEALVRWKTSAGLTAAPEIFLPLAESSGIFAQLSPLVVEKTLDGFSEFKKAGLPLFLSMNLSARQVRSQSVHRHLLDSVQQRGLNPSEIRLEIPEGALLESPQECRTMIEKYSSDGFRLALDNYGLNRAALLPEQNCFDTFILDRSLIQRLGWQRKEEVVIRALVQLTADLGISLAAKGVETFQQKELLKTLGVADFQGFFYAAALPPGEFLEFTARRQNPGR